jgi:hypothetical protein
MNQENVGVETSTMATYSQSKLNNCAVRVGEHQLHMQRLARAGGKVLAALTAGELVHLPFDPRARHSSPFTYPELARARLIPHTLTPNLMPFFILFSFSLSLDDRRCVHFSERCLGHLRIKISPLSV